MHLVFSIALHPPPRRCFGVDLLPLTVGHLLLLRELRCPVSDPGFRMELGHYLLACYACAQDHRSARQTLTSKSRWVQWRLDRFLSKWTKTVKEKMDPVAEARRFLRYRNEMLSAPTIIGSDKGDSLPSSPEEYRTIAMLMSEFYMNRQAAEDTEFPFATAIWVANRDRKGTKFTNSTVYELTQAAIENHRQPEATATQN